MKSYSQEEKGVAKKYLDEHCPAQKGWVSAECFNSKQKVDAPTIGGEGKNRPASDKEYEQCLRENGL